MADGGWVGVTKPVCVQGAEWVSKVSTVRLLPSHGPLMEVSVRARVGPSYRVNRMARW